jgi:hypothetical protein
MAILTITDGKDDYGVSDDPMHVPEPDGFLLIVAPSDDCMVCVEPEFPRDSNPVIVHKRRQIDLTGYPIGTTWTYSVYSCKTKSCPPEKVLLAAHAIQIGN